MEPEQPVPSVEEVDAATLDERAVRYLGVLDDLQRRLGLPAT